MEGQDPVSVDLPGKGPATDRDEPEGSAPGRTVAEGRLLAKIVLHLHAPLMRFAFRLRWEGLQNVPMEGGAILSPNHASHIDPAFVLHPVYFHRGGRLVRYMAVDIHFSGINGFYRRLFDAVPMSHDYPDWMAFQAGREVLEAGHLLGVFPEGERTHDGRMLPFREGAAHLAAQAGVPLIPVTLNGTYRVLPRHRSCPRPGPVEVIYHPPLPVDSARKNDRGYLASVTRKLQETVRSRYRPPAASEAP